MRKILAVVALLTALSASAGTITSRIPSTFTKSGNSGEYFITIYGNRLRRTRWSSTGQLGPFRAGHQR